MNICPGRDELFHAGSCSDERPDVGADGRTEGRHEEANSL